MTDDFLVKVTKIAKVKYEIDEEVIEAYSDILKECYEREFTPRRTVEYIATDLFG